MLNYLLSLVLFLAFVSIGCGGPGRMGAKKVVPRPFQHEDANAEKNQNNQNEESNPGDQLTLEEIREIPIAFGIRSFEQIYESMAVLTDVNPLTRLGDGQTVNQKYMELSSQLPESNDAKAFLASHQVAISKLAVEYCDALMSDAGKRGQMFPSVNFGQGVASSLAGTNGQQFAMELINQFWGKGLNNRPSDGTLQDEITQLISDLSKGENAGAATSTLNVTKGACAAVLASAPAMFL